MLAGTDEEKLAAASTFVAYCGRYDYQGDRVIHEIEVAFYPNRVGHRAGEIRSPRRR